MHRLALLVIIEELVVLFGYREKQRDESSIYNQFVLLSYSYWSNQGVFLTLLFGRAEPVGKPICSNCLCSANY